MDLQLAGRVIVVVGGTGTLGSAIVQRLRLEGALVVPASRGGHPGIALDARDESAVREALAAVVAEHGRLDGVVVTAAPSARTLDPALASDPGQVLDALDAKALTFLRVANAALPLLTDAGFGRILGISGQNALLTGNITGSVRNAALIIIAKNLADAAAGSGVTVNVINPGTVSDTPSASVEAGRPGESAPADTADLAAFLLSPLAGAISGEAIAVGHRVRGRVDL